MSQIKTFIVIETTNVSKEEVADLKVGLNIGSWSFYDAMQKVDDAGNHEEIIKI